MTSASTRGSLIGKIGSYLQIVTTDPSSTAFVPLAEAYRQIGLLDDALEAARLGTKMLPHFSPGFSTLGRVLGQMGRIDEAMNAYANALSIDRQSQAGLVGLARLHLIRSERDQARKILKQAEEFHPDDEKIADMLIALDLPRPWAKIKHASQIQRAVDDEDAAPVEPTEPIPTATLAEIYFKQGLLDKACKIYQEILANNPDNDAARERILKIHELLNIRPEPLSGIETYKSVQETFEENTPPTVSPPSPEVQKSPEDQPLLAVLQRWLNAIKDRRVNV